MLSASWEAMRHAACSRPAAILFSGAWPRLYPGALPLHLMLGSMPDGTFRTVRDLVAAGKQRPLAIDCGVSRFRCCVGGGLASGAPRAADTCRIPGRKVSRATSDR